MTGGDDARFGLLMGSLGIKLVGRARPLDYLALMRGILHARGIKLPQDLSASALDAKVRQLHVLHTDNRLERKVFAYNGQGTMPVLSSHVQHQRA